MPEQDVNAESIHSGHEVSHGHACREVDRLRLPAMVDHSSSLALPGWLVKESYVILLMLSQDIADCLDSVLAFACSSGSN